MASETCSQRIARGDRLGYSEEFSRTMEVPGARGDPCARGPSSSSGRRVAAGGLELLMCAYSVAPLRCDEASPEV